MICIEKKNILNGFGTIKGRDDKKFLYFHIEVEKSSIEQSLTLMLCTDTIRYFVMELNKNTAELNTERKLVFNGTIEDIEKIITVSENKISIAIFNKENLVIVGYDVGISYPIIHLPISEEKLIVKTSKKQISAKEKVSKDNNIGENLNITKNNNSSKKKKDSIKTTNSDNLVNNDRIMKNDILEEVSLTKNSNKENIMICEKNNLQASLKEKNIDIPNKEMEKVTKNIKKVEPEKENNLVPFNITINENVDTTKDLRLLQSSELIKKMFFRATTSRELKDEPNNMIIFKITYTNFKKIALNENIYYIPINLIVSMLKKEIILSERFIVTIVFKKNSPYIKYIQIAIQASNRNLNLDNLTNFKYCCDLQNNIGYWVYNYEP